MAISILYVLQESGLDVHHGKVSCKYAMGPFWDSLGKGAWFSCIYAPIFALHRSFAGGMPEWRIEAVATATCLKFSPEAD